MPRKPKMIVVLGEPGAGKTPSIRRFFEKRGGRYGRGDILTIIHIRKNHKSHIIGIVSAADVADTLKKDLECLRRAKPKCDFYICAARSCRKKKDPSYTEKIVRAFADDIRASELTWININDSSQIDDVANAIERAIQ